jgi:tetratricopeptide (TPR) repeat protein
MHDGNMDDARHYMEAARTAGTHNVVALTQYGIMTKDSERAIAILKEALTLDPKYPEAHWALGDKISDPRRRLAEWKQAVALAPRHYEWWEQYAKLCLDQKQYAEAGRAWLAAAQAAPDAAHRDSYLASRGQIDDLRLDDEAGERRREAAAKAAEIERLKAEARKEIADMEAKVNTRPLTKEDTEKAVDWFEINGSGSVTGTLTRVQCANRQFQLDVKDDMGKAVRLLVVDPSQISISGSDATLSCGAAKQRPRAVVVTFKPTKDTKGFAGEVTGIEFR